MDGIRVNRQPTTRADKKCGTQSDGKIKPEKCIVSPADKKKNVPINILKRSIRRAWTINGSFDYWASARTSTSARVYRSLPSDRNVSARIPYKKCEIAKNSPLRCVESAIKSRLITDNKRDQYKNKVQLSNNENKSSKNGNKIAWLKDKTTIGKCKSENTTLAVPSKLTPGTLERINVSPDTKILAKNGEKKSNIPIFRRNSREFEDISNLRSSSKRSFIPSWSQRHRGSADDLRRFHEDANLPSLIPKLSMSQKGKESKIRRYQLSSENISRLNSSVSGISKSESPVRYEELTIDQNVIDHDETPVTAATMDFLETKLHDSVKTCKNSSTAGDKNEEQDDDDAEEKAKGKDEKLVVSADENARKNEEELHPQDVEQTQKLEENEGEKYAIGEAKTPDKKPMQFSESSLEYFQSTNENESSIINGPDDIMTNIEELSYEKKIDHVLRRKYSKEESFNTDDTDDTTPNRRCSSHLSPEASPLSTRSSKYSPRESESEPTPALARKTTTSGGEACLSSQRIRDAITRTRRESNSSTRYESSGSDSIRLSESGFHDYVDLARRVRMMGNHYYCQRVSIESDEPVQRDSATSAGEDESHENCDPLRFSGSSASQGRTILRRRRQFDSQGSRRRGRSHARVCCSEDLPNLQISRHQSPTRHRGIVNGQDPPNPDYRRLVFISSDSSSGREEDDADSSCSSSSYLNGLPRNSHAQSLEDCDWDYFESDTLPLSSALSKSPIKSCNIHTYIKDRDRNWDCCLGRGSGTCLACGGSPGRNVLPVPVPIPVPVPYPVPVPAALWNNGHFAATASSMITSSSEIATTKFRDFGQALPWFSWHPRFYQPDTSMDKNAGAAATSSSSTTNFDPANILAFSPHAEILLSPYGIINSSHSLKLSSFIDASNVNDNLSIPRNSEISSKPDGSSEKVQYSEEQLLDTDACIDIDKEVELTMSSSEKNDEEILPVYSDCREDSESSSGRSSADSSDLDETTSPRFSRIFVVNDDSLTSENDDSTDNHSHDIVSSKDNGIVLKSITNLSDNESGVLPSVKLYEQDTNEPNKSTIYQQNEAYIATSIDYDDDHIELKSIRPLDSDQIQLQSANYSSGLGYYELDYDKCYDSSVIPDSLELPETRDVPKVLRINQSIGSLIENQISENAVECDKPFKYLNLSTDGETNIKSGSKLIGDELPESLDLKASSSLEEMDRLLSNSSELIEDNKEQKTIKSNDISDRLNEILKNVESINFVEQICNENEKTVRGEKSLDSEQVRSVGENDSAARYCGNGPRENSGEESVERGTSRFRSVERCPPTRKVENGSPPTSVSIAAKDQTNSHNLNSNKYKSLVMITQGAYQPVSVITSDTTTLLQPDGVEVSQGLAGYYHLALEAVADETHQRKGRKPLMVRRLATLHSEPNEADSGLSVGSTSESDDAHLNNMPINDKSQKIRNQFEDLKTNVDDTSVDGGAKSSLSSQSTVDNPGDGTILEEGLADDDSWVEEVSHDEDEQSGTTLTEESSEDEIHGHLGDHEEELRGYHRQAIDFTLHTIVEESCEESEAEPSLGLSHWEKKQRPPSASDLEKYFFFGLGGDCTPINANINSIIPNTINNPNGKNGSTSSGSSSNTSSSSSSTNNINNSNNGNNNSAQELDSLSETSSVYSEVLESLGQDDLGLIKEKCTNDFANSSRLEKYFLSEFLGFDQDRRDSDGSVGSDSEGRPSPEAQRRKRLVRARGTGRSHSSSLDNLLALTQSNQNLSSQNSLQDLSINQDSQDTQSGDSSTETDGLDDGQTALFGVDGQFDTVKRKKKKPRNLGSQSPRVVDDSRNKSPELREANVSKSTNILTIENEQLINPEDDRSKTPEVELGISAAAATATVTSSVTTSSPANLDINYHSNSNEQINLTRNKQQSRDSGFIGSCDDLLQHQKPPSVENKSDIVDNQPKDCSLATLNRENIGGHDARREDSESSTTEFQQLHTGVPLNANVSLSRKDSFNNWSSDEETNLMMSKMRQFFKTMVANSNSQPMSTVYQSTNQSNVPSPSPSPRLSGYTSAKIRISHQNRTKPPQLVYFENELTRLMKTVPGIRDEQVREIVEYLSSEDTWSDSYDSSDYTSSDLEGAAGGRRSALQEQISQSCQQIINNFEITTTNNLNVKGKSREQEKNQVAVEQEDNKGKHGHEEEDETEEDEEDDEEEGTPSVPLTRGGRSRDTAFVYQKLVQSFTKMASDSSHASSDASSTPHSSPPLIAKVMHHIGSRLVALMHQVSESNPTAPVPTVPSNAQHSTWRRYAQHHRTLSSASTTEDDDSTSDSTHTSSLSHSQLQLPRSKSHDPLLLINGHPAANGAQEGEEREASDYERFSWRGSFESALMAADSRTKLSLLACSGDVNASSSASALAMAAKRRSAGDLLFNPKSFSREQLDRVRSCGSIGDGNSQLVVGNASGGIGSIEEKIWNNRRRSSVPDANIRGESGVSVADDDTEDELEYNGDPRATTLPRGILPTTAATAATNSLPRLSASSSVSTTSATIATSSIHKAHSMYYFLPQHANVKSARYRPPGFARNSNNGGAGPKRAVSAPGLEIAGGHGSGKIRDTGSRSRRREQAISLMPDDGSSLSEACSTPIIGGSSPRLISRRGIIDGEEITEHGTLHSGHHIPNTRASLSSLGARSDSMASVYSGAGEGKWCGSVVVRGEVEFSLQYDYKQLSFQVHISQCRDLAAVDNKRSRSDPYVKVYLLPDKSKGGKRKTKVKKHTLNPVFDETLKFHMSLNGLETRTLWLTVWHSDMFGRNDFLGEVRMPLENKIFNDPTPRWYPLQERTETFDDPISNKGEVIVGLKFVPPDPVQLEKEREMDGSDNRILSKGKRNWNRGALHVLVKEARNLQTRAKNSGTCDPFCKSYLLPDKGRSGKHKTNVVRRSGGSPVWNHTIVYKDVSLQELAERGLELTVWDYDRIASNEFLGGVRFNLGTGKHYGKSVDWMDATGREMSLWQNMLERPNFWVEGVVILRPNLYKNHGSTS